MTAETPCLPECRPQIGHACDGLQSAFSPAYHAPNCPNAPKPAEPPACKCGGNQIPNVAHTPDGCYSVPAVPQGSEPPIDPRHAEQLALNTLDNKHGYEVTLARAYLSLKAERDALKAGVDFQKTMRAATITRNMDLQGQNNALLAENAALKAENMRLAYGHAELQDKVDALKARMEALTVVGRRVVKRRNKHYKDVRDSVDALETVLAKNACLPTCGTYEHVVEDQHANGCPVLRKEQEASRGAHMTRENAALKARVEELEGAIVDATQRANYSAWIVLDDMANAIRARKEASNGK